MAIVISRTYEVLDLIDHQGMGVVYKVRHTALNTIFALKALAQELTDNQDMVRRFSREAGLKTQLRHPNIVRVLDVGHDVNLPCHYFVMEYLRGKPFRQYLQQKGPLPFLEVLEIGWQVAQVLSYTHNLSLPLVHQEIKPSNIMIEDGSCRAVVLDCGISNERDREESTKDDVLDGVLYHSAPEQLRREPIDKGADIYSVGMLLYEAYAGKLCVAELEDHEPLFPRLAPREFRTFITKAIAKSPSRRYQRIEEFLHDLDVCWNALDQTNTIIAPVSSLSAPPRDSQPEHNLTGIEEKDHELTKERQRQLCLAAQTQAQESRERAIQNEAGRWAPVVFQQGLEREARSLAFLRRHEFVQAQQGYHEAVSLFIQASEEAKNAALRHRVRQARADMETAKAEAERCGAPKSAHTFHARGLALRAKADALRQTNLHEQSVQFYIEARVVFEDACELAVHLGLKTAAETARAAMHAARAAAIQGNAGSLMLEAVRAAEHARFQADTAFSAHEYTQARECYETARHGYQTAQEQVHAIKTERKTASNTANATPGVYGAAWRRFAFLWKAKMLRVT